MLFPVHLHVALGPWVWGRDTESLRVLCPWVQGGGVGPCQPCKEDPQASSPTPAGSQPCSLSALLAMAQGQLAGARKILWCSAEAGGGDPKDRLEELHSPALAMPQPGRKGGLGAGGGERWHRLWPQSRMCCL